MARAKDAPTDVGGQMHPAAVEQAARSRQFAEQKAMLGTQEAAETARTKTAVQGRTRVANIQAASQQNVAAMQVASADRQRAQQVKDNEADRELAVLMQKRDHQSNIELETLRENKADARHDKNVKTYTDMRDRIEKLLSDDAAQERYRSMVLAKALYGMAKETVTTEEQRAKIQVGENKIRARNDADLTIRDNIRQAVADKYSSNRWVSLPIETVKDMTLRKSVFERVKLRPGASSFREEVTKTVYDGTASFVNEELLKHTNNLIGLGFTVERTKRWLEGGFIKYGDMLKAISTLEAFRTQLKDTISHDEAAIPAGDRMEDASQRKITSGIYDGHVKVLDEVDDVLFELRKLKDHPSANVKEAYNMARGNHDETALNGLIAAFRDKNKITPTSMDEQLDRINQIIAGLDIPTFTGPRAEEQRKELKHFQQTFGELLDLPELSPAGGQ